MRSTLTSMERHGAGLVCALLILVCLVPPQLLAQAGQAEIRHPGDQRMVSNAFETWQGGPPLVLTMHPTRTLHPVTSSELMGGPQELAISMPAGGARTGSNLTSVISRRIPDLWQVSLDPQAVISELQATYRLVAESGRESCLSHSEKPDQHLVARLRPIAPVSRPTAANRVLVSGGVIIEIEAADVRLAGAYRGTIEIMINQI